MKATNYNAIKNTALVCTVPLIGLAYVIALPFIGLVTGLWLAARAFAAHWTATARWMRNAALFLIAPLVGLAYAFAFPFVGAGLLVWRATRVVA